MEKPHLHAASFGPVEKLFGVQVKSDTHCGRPALLPRDGQPHPPPLFVVRRSSKPPWATYSTSWASPAVGSSSSSPSSRAVTILSALAGEPRAPRQADQPAACGRAGIFGLSGSWLMPRVPCVLPRPASRCSMLVRVSAGVVCHCLCVSSDDVFAVPVVCDRTRAGAAVQGCAWSPWQGSRPMSWWGGSRALWACGMTWGGRIASRLCANRVRAPCGVREKVLRYACPEVRVNVSGWYECFRVVLI
jgi:hypothetical protein